MKYPIDFDLFYEPNISYECYVNCKVCDSSAHKPEEVKHEEWCPVGQILSTMVVEFKNTKASLSGFRIRETTLGKLHSSIVERFVQPVWGTELDCVDYPMEFNLIVPFDFHEQEAYLKELKELRRKQIVETKLRELETYYTKELKRLEKNKKDYSEEGYQKQLAKINKKYGKTK